MGPQKNKKANKSLNILKVYLSEKHYQPWTWLWMPLPALLLMVKGRWTLKSVMHACMLSHFSHIRLFATLWTVMHQAPLSMEFSRQEYWSGLPCSPPGDLPNPGIEPASPTLLHWQVDSLPLSHHEAPQSVMLVFKSLLYSLLAVWSQANNSQLDALVFSSPNGNDNYLITVSWIG